MITNGHRRALLVDARSTRHSQCRCAAAPAAPSVLLASATSSVRKAWRAGLHGLPAVEVADHAQLVCSLTPHAPAVLLLDLDLPDLGGMDGLPGLRALQPETRLVVLAGRPDDKQGLAALKLGVQGYCDRAIAPALLGKAVDAVLNGEVWVGRKLTSHLLDELSALTDSMGEPAPAAVSDHRLDRLTPRERAIVDELGAGASNKDIAQKFSVTERTVKAHLTAVFRKLEIPGRLQVAVFMAELGRSHLPN